MSAQSEFEDLIEDHHPDVRSWAQAASALVLSVRPDATVEFEKAWGGYLLFRTTVGGGNTVCFISAHKKHVSLGFSEGAELSDPSGLLQGSGKRQRHVKIKKSEDLERHELRNLIEAAWARQPDVEVLEGALEKVRALCLSYPKSSETISHGHPTFKVGKKSFAVYGIYSPSVAFKADGLHAELEGDECIFPTPYMANKGWLSIRVDQETDWERVAKLVDHSYRVAR